MRQQQSKGMNLKTIAGLLIFFVSFSVFAQEEVGSSSKVTTTTNPAAERPMVPEVEQYQKKLTWSKIKIGEPLTKFAEEAVEKHPILLKPADRVTKELASICPRFNKMDDAQKKRFWVLFASEVAYAESRLNPNLVYEAQFHGSTAQRIRNSESQQRSSRTQYGIYAQTIGEKSACNFTKMEETRDFKAISDCFFNELSNKIESVTCLFCQTGKNSLVYLQAGVAKQEFRRFFFSYTPCSE